MQPGGDPTLFPQLAKPVLDLAEIVATTNTRDIQGLLKEADRRLKRFEAEAHRRGAVETSVAPARYGLLVILDTRARDNRAIPIKTWSAGAHSLLFDGRDVSLSGLRDLHDKAEAAGEDYHALRVFLGHCIEAVESTRAKVIERRKSPIGKALLIGLPVVVVLGLAGVSWLEWQYRAELLASLDQPEAALRGGSARDPKVLAERLNALASATRAVESRTGDAPAGLFNAIPALSPAKAATDRYHAGVAATVPPILHQAVDISLASEGENIALYDTLRAHGILGGQSDWSVAYLAGWAAANDDLVPGLAGLAAHIPALSGPDPNGALPDSELLAQARQFAVEADEAERAYLELLRSAPAADLPGWVPRDEISGLDTVLLRRSGVPLSTPMPGLFTDEGWTYARDFGAGLAVQETRRQARLILAETPSQINNAPDQVMATLQRETLDQWRAFLNDLRVKPFEDQGASVLISGRLGASNSPLKQLLEAVWVEVGGRDRNRAHSNQLAIATEFGPMIQYVEQGRMQRISQLFAGLNVALSTLDRNEDVGARKLMDVQARARSVSTLRQSPTLVVQIVEDVLAQTGATVALENPVQQLWQRNVAPSCLGTVDGRFPFGEGPDISMEEFTRLFGPNGVIDQFYRLRIGNLVDTTASPWRWKPEARFAGFDPETAQFFERAAAIRTAFFADGGSPATNLTMAALAQRGEASVTLGGQSAPVRTTGEPAVLAWPGANPAGGMELAFQTPTGVQRKAEAGPWGLLRMLAPLRLRERDGGKRYLLDFRFQGARLFVEMSFESEINPVSRRGLLKGLQCPASL